MRIANAQFCPCAAAERFLGCIPERGAASRDDERWQPAAENHEVSRVLNYFALETEVAHRRCEWELALAAAERHAQVRPQNGPKPWSHLAPRTLKYLRALATPRVPVTCWNTVGEQRARSLEGGSATVT
jgi:hypothetical protein